MSIYQETPSSAFPLPVTAALNEQLGFTCQTLIVDNYTNQYLYFPDIARYVPPSTFGTILPYRPMNSIRATFTPPPGITPAIINTVQSASVTALAAQVPPSPGVSTNDTFNINQGTVDAVITGSSVTIDANATLVHTISSSILSEQIPLTGPGHTFLGWGNAEPIIGWTIGLDPGATTSLQYQIGTSATVGGSVYQIGTGTVKPGEMVQTMLPAGLAARPNNFIDIFDFGPSGHTIYIAIYPSV